MKHHRFNVFLLCFVLSISYLYSDISISASVDKNTISLDEQINLQIVVSGNVTNIPTPTIPDLPDFQIQSSGRSQNISIINGRVSSSVNFNYILSPRKIGDFIINPVTIEYQGKIYQTQPINIKVTKSQQVKQLPTERGVYKGTGKGIFIETTVDKHRVYVNQQVTLTFRFFTKINLLSQPQYSPPTTTGFVVEDLPPQKNYYTVIDGERYYVSEIKTALFPLTAGKNTIGPAVLKCMIEDFDIDDFFSDSFFRRFFSQGKEVVLKSDPVEITVLPLPSPQPSDFNGAVGDYNITASLDTTKLEVNSTTMLNIKISGVGNVKPISFTKSMLQKYLGQNFVIFDPITSFDIKKENYQVMGTKNFKIPISPSVPGQIVIPEIKFVYFNPSTNRYETATTKPISLNVSPAKTVSLTPRGKRQNVTQSMQDRRLQLEDIRYIKTKLKYRRHYTIPSLLLVLLQILPFLCWGSVLGYRMYNENILKDIKNFRFVKAFKEVKKKINSLKTNWKKNDIKENMRILYDILMNYFADKMNISAEGVSIDLIKKFYTEKKVDLETLSEVILLWDEINFWRFSQSKPANVNFDEMISKIEKIITKLEYELQKM